MSTGKCGLYKNTKGARAAEMKEKKICPYCSKKHRQKTDFCSNCARKKRQVHEFWLICQEIKKIVYKNDEEAQNEL